MYNILENKIINYINQTPENTNPSVLATLLGELKVSKPLTYDYMPEGYPSKTVETITLMEEQRLSFKYMDNLYVATLPVSIDLVEGQTYVVTFDGIIYKCLCKLNRNVEYIGSDQNENGVLVGDEPFCVSNGFVAARCDVYLDPYIEHTIGITTVVETITPMSEEFLPNTTTGGVTTLHINVTAVNMETMTATFTADKTPAEMAQATATGPVWCVVTFAAGIMDDSAVSIGVPPAWIRSEVAFGVTTAIVHNGDGSNKIAYAVREGFSDSWILKLDALMF